MVLINKLSKLRSGCIIGSKQLTKVWLQTFLATECMPCRGNTTQATSFLFVVKFANKLFDS